MGYSQKATTVNFQGGGYRDETYRHAPVVIAASASINFPPGGFTGEDTSATPSVARPCDGATKQSLNLYLGINFVDIFAKMFSTGKTRMIGLPYAEENITTC